MFTSHLLVTPVQNDVMTSFVVGETLLSPLVMCGPHGLKFLQPVELRLPHCASVNPNSWSFALKSSDSPAGHSAHWQNMSLAGLEGVPQGQVGTNSVSVLVDHF